MNSLVLTDLTEVCRPCYYFAPFSSKHVAIIINQYNINSSHFFQEGIPLIHFFIYTSALYIPFIINYSTDIFNFKFTNSSINMFYPGILWFWVLINGSNKLIKLLLVPVSHVLIVELCQWKHRYLPVCSLMTKIEEGQTIQWKRTKGQTMIDKILHRKKVEYHKPKKNPLMISGTPEW